MKRPNRTSETCSIRKTLPALFVCSMNPWHRPMAEEFCSNYPGVNSRSCEANRNANRSGKRCRGPSGNILALDERPSPCRTEMVWQLNRRLAEFSPIFDPAFWDAAAQTNSLGGQQLGPQAVADQ